MTRTTLSAWMKRPALLLAAFLLGSCAPSVDMPRGTSKGYTSARLVNRDPGRKPGSNATEQQVNRLIQRSISNQFTSKGLAYGKSGAQLTVAYMVIYQEPGMTARYDDYYGYGRDSNQISDVAHIRGSIDNQRPDYFQQAGIVIDVIDSTTHKLVYRNFAKGDVIRGASEATRAARINAAVGQALAPFFAAQ